ncbi:RluA family pseudouridine synthase [Desulfovermiculus halophilus]|uniref:RluA family pseudouridine synthase n=1 Tax=Desulfovermiculus halophilus TaxID=339722 RepID=UPI000488F4ED|nr:RluA family pseudouridine synthase [Desulfovermiculus halophilus]
MPKVSHIEVSRAESGQKLLQFLARQLQGQVPRSAVMRWIRTGQVRVDGGRCKPFGRIKQGQTVRLPPYVSSEETTGLSGQSANPFALQKVDEDDEVLVLAKPPGLAAQPGTKVTDSVSSRLEVEYAHTDWIPALVHRLDMPTSGLLLVAKTYAALQHMQGLWRSGAVTKIYLAWVWGHPDWPEWEYLADDLVKVRDGREQTVRALAWGRTLRRGEQASLVAVRLITGRKHQIRIQMSRRGFPVVGDRKYGPGKSGGQGLLLHAAVLGWEDRRYHLAPPWEAPYGVSQEDMDEFCLEPKHY